jgi:3-isopropylmalate/(R)-2-methylmalate dehydratase small subunit
MTLVESAPSTELLLDLQTMTVRDGSESHPISLPGPARDAFLNGTWDATGLLLSDFDDVRLVASRLPYVSGW